MQVTVKKICPYDDCNGSKMLAVVGFYDEEAEFHNSAKVEIFIEKHDAHLSDLKKEAVQTALDFLRQALSSHF